MAGKKKITKEIEDEIVQLYLSGLTYKQIKEKINISGNSIQKVLENNNIQRRKYKTPCKYNCNTHFLDVLDTPEKNYFVGFFSADGYNSYNKNEIILELQERDKDFLIQLNTLFDNERPLVTIEKKLKGKVYREVRICIHGKELCENMNKYNCIQNKTATYSIPLCFKNSNNVFTKDFIRGYFDGDGCLYYNECTNDIKIIFCCNGDTCIDLKEIIYDNLGIVCSSYCKNNDTWYVEIHARKDVINFCNWIYYDDCLCLKRKYEKFIKFINI